MNLFTVDSIQVYPECSDRICKAIRPGIFQLTDHLVDGFFAKNINISAIVGMNGSGKSSLLEIMYRMINNLGAILLKEIETNAAASLRYVCGIFADLNYSIGEEKGTLKIRDTQIGLKCGEKSWLFKLDKNATHTDFSNFRACNVIGHEDLKEISTYFFYSIVTNYSIQSYVARNYKGEPLKVFDGINWNEDIHHNWIDSLFHKNDGYSCPITLNPYRENGRIDMINEEKLTNDRLQYLLIYFQKKGYKYLPNYELHSVNFRFSQDKIISPFKNAYLREDRKHKYKRILTNFKQACQDEDSVASTLLQYFQINQPQVEDNIVWAARLYLVTKVLLIAQKYPSYQKYSSWGDPELAFKIGINQEEKKELKKLGKQLRDDKSHIITKLKRVLHFLDFCEQIPHIKSIYQGFSYEKYEKWMRDDEKRYKISELVNIMPPSFFLPSIDLKKTLEDRTEVICPLQHMSTGERQFMHSTSAIVYHILNLQSVKKDGNRPSYRHLNIIMDEVEICYHPEYQRMYVKMFLDLLKQLLITDQTYLNIILTTHSPFILSDIPMCNILYLEDGKSISSGEFINPFGANVYDILKQSFFLKNGFMGEFAKKKINSLVTFLTSEHRDDRAINLNNAQKLINLIGEPLIRDNLQELLDEFIKQHPESNTEMIEDYRQRRIQELREELNRLENL